MVNDKRKIVAPIKLATEFGITYFIIETIILIIYKLIINLVFNIFAIFLGAVISSLLISCVLVIIRYYLVVLVTEKTIQRVFKYKTTYAKKYPILKNQLAIVGLILLLISMLTTIQLQKFQLYYTNFVVVLITMLYNGYIYYQMFKIFNEKVYDYLISTKDDTIEDKIKNLDEEIIVRPTNKKNNNSYLENFFKDDELMKKQKMKEDINIYEDDTVDFVSNKEEGDN